MPNLMVALPNIGGALCSTPLYFCPVVSFYLLVLLFLLA